MAFNDDETSVQDGERIELYRLVGTYNTYYLTSWDVDFVNSEATWEAKALDRENVERGTHADDELDVTVQIAANHPVVAEYAINVAPPTLTLTILQVHPANPDSTVILFEGPVLSWSVSGRIATMNAPNIFSYLFDKPLPGHKYQAPCNFRLGSDQCGVDMTLPENTHDTTIDSFTDTLTIEVADSPFPDGACVAGRMIVGSEERTIVSNVGTTFTIRMAFSPNIIATNAVTIRRGCNKLFLGDCIQKFNNARNFGGFPYIPNQNPYSNRL